MIDVKRLPSRSGTLRRIPRSFAFCISINTGLCAQSATSVPICECHFGCKSCVDGRLGRLAELSISLRQPSSLAYIERVFGFRRHTSSTHSFARKKDLPRAWQAKRVIPSGIQPLGAQIAPKAQSCLRFLAAQRQTTEEDDSEHARDAHPGHRPPSLTNSQLSENRIAATCHFFPKGLASAQIQAVSEFRAYCAQLVPNPGQRLPDSLGSPNNRIGDRLPVTRPKPGFAHWAYLRFGI